MQKQLRCLMTRTKIVFLYSEIAGYFLACAKALSLRAEVLIVRWPTNREAPFEFADASSIKLVDKSDYTLDTLKELVNSFSPDIVVCSGWMDKDYLKVVKQLDPKVKRVLSLDNHWKGNLKQRVATWLSPFFLKNKFTHAWVPGSYQYTFAEKLGFSGAILKGVYCADTDLFEGKFKQSFDKKKENFPKRFLYVARYVEHKGIFEMWNAFIELQKKHPNDWELWCLGTGDQWDNKIEHEKIKHFGFVQPEQMDEYIQNTGVYVLPSKFEPWGVTAQEFAVSGFPLLLSEQVGSAEAFLNEENGICFEAGNQTIIEEAMKKIIEMTDEELVLMGEKSHQLGMSYTPEDWAERIISIKHG